MGVSSLASVAGRRNGTSPPWLRAIAAICSLSVDTTHLAISGQSFDKRMEWAIKGNPARRAIFLPGRPREPPRAGITARTGWTFIPLAVHHAGSQNPEGYMARMRMAVCRFHRIACDLRQM